VAVTSFEIYAFIAMLLPIKKDDDDITFVIFCETDSNMEIMAI